MAAVGARQGFAERLESGMAEISYFRVGDEADRDRVYRLRYDCYLAEGAIHANDRARYHDRHDEDANALIFGICHEGRLAGSIRLHVTSPHHPVGPGLDVFPDVLEPLLDAEESFVDPTRFVVDAGMRRAMSLMPYATLRLAAMAADHFDTEQILATVRIEHTPFYRRVFGLQPLTPPRDYPSLTKPICLMAAYTDEIREDVYRRYPIFSSDPAERIALFGPSRAKDFALSPRSTTNDNAGRIFQKVRREA